MKRPEATDEAVRILRVQTIPALRASGGGGHADAIETVLAELDRRGRFMTMLAEAKAVVEAKLDDLQAEGHW